MASGVLVATFLLLAVLEVLCRLLGLGERQAVAKFIANWQLEWKDDFSLFAPGEGITADGVRDRPHDVENPRNDLRVVFLGDSVTFGYPLSFEESYPAMFQREAQARGLAIEVFNIALPGWSLRQQRIAYQRIARKYRPHHVVLGFCLNDVPEMQNNLARPDPVVAFFYTRYNLVRALLRPSQVEISRVRELFSNADRANVKNGWNLYLKDLRAFLGELSADGVQFTMLVFPFRYQFKPGAPDPVPQRIIMKFCAETGLRCVDLLPVLAGLGVSAFLDYDHLSPEGARLVAMSLFQPGVIPRTPPVR